MSSRGSRSAHQGVTKIDLGFSDEEDEGFKPETAKAESVNDLLNQKSDSSMKLGGGSSRRRPSFQIGAGIDPLESLLSKGEQKEKPDDEENAEEFEREFRKITENVLGEKSFASTAPAEVLREQESDRPEPSVGQKPDFDLVSDILGEEPRSVPVSERSRPSLRRSSTEPLVKEEADTSRRREEPEASRDFRRGLNRSRFGMPDPSQSGGSDAAFSEGRFDESEGRPSGPLEGGRFEVELNPRTKRSLPKAKPSPSSSRVNTPGPEPENPPAASTPQRPPREPASSPPRSRGSEGAPSELAQPQPSRASEHSTSGRGSLRVPPTLPLHQAVATKAHASDSSRQARQGDTSGMPATEGTRAAAISQVRQESTVPIAKLLAEQEAARRLPTPGDADDTPPSQRDVSFFDVGNRGFSDKPPATSAPDLYLQVAQKDAKVRHLELQLEDCEERWKRRMEDAKRQENESLARMELQCRYLQSELDRCKEIQASDERRFIEQKRQLAQGHQTEKEDAIREERRKVQTELDKMKSDHRLEIEELKRQHERAVTIIKQQADVEADNLRRAQTGEQHLTKLVEQVRGSVAEVERLSKRVDSDKSLEWSVRERQVEARERNAKELEAQLSRQSKEVEEQRRRLSDLVTNLQNCQDEDSTVLASERERLQAEHQRLLELQQSIREADRNQKEFLKHAWAQVEEERRILQQEQLRFDGEQATRKEELEMQERQLKSETDRLKALHQQIEVARQSAARRIRETESTVANERRCLMNDLEAFEEKRRSHASQAMKLESDRRQLQEEKGNFEGELHSVGLMAQELERRSEEIRVLHEEAAEARGELQLLRGQLQEERSAQGTEMERLKTMQSLIEQQRLQLLQTENQLRLQGVEDIDLQVTTQGHFPAELNPVGNAQEAMGRWTPELLETREAKVPGPTPLTRRPLATPCRAGDFQIRSKLQRSRKGSGEMQSYLLQSAAFLQEAQRSTPALQAAAHAPSITSSDMLEDVGSSQSSSADM